MWLMRERSRGQKTMNCVTSYNRGNPLILLQKPMGMAELFYREDRDSDFFNVCEQVRIEHGYISVSQIVAKAILKPANSFYIHRREYASIIKRNGSLLPRNEIKRLLHLEILNRFHEIKENNPDMCILDITKIISEQKAPRFYISQRRAEDIYYDLLKKPQSIFSL